MRRRWLLAAAVIVMTAIAGYGASRVEFDDVPRSVIKTEHGDFVYLEKLFDDFGSDDNDVVVLLEADDIFAPEVVRTLRRIAAAAREVDGVQSVRSLEDVILIEPGSGPRSLLPDDGASAAEFSQARQAALRQPLVRGQVISEDGQAAMIVVRLAGNALSVKQIAPRIDQLREAIDASDPPPGLSIQVTGVPAVRVEIIRAVQRDSRRFILIGVIVACGMALILFRQPWAVFIVSLAAMLGAFWTVGTLGLVGEKINVINTILPTLVMIIGFTDAVHLMTDIRHSRRAGIPPLPAARRAIRYLGMPCLLTSITTAVGFGSLAVARVDIIRRFGIACSLGSVFAFLAVLIVVPLLSSTRLGWRVTGKRSHDFADEPTPWLGRLTEPIVRHAKLVALLGTLLSLALATSAFRLRPDFRLVESVPADNDAVAALARCEEHFGGSVTASVVVEWPDDLQLDSPGVLEAIAQVQQILADEPGMHYPTSVRDLLSALPGLPGDLSSRVGLLALAPDDVTRRYLRADLHRALVTARLPDDGMVVHEPIFQSVEQKLAALQEQLPGWRLQLTGTVVVASRNIAQMIRDLADSLLMASVVIFVLLSLAFRSLKLGLLSVLPNIFPLALTATALVATGHPLQLTSVIVFSICLGIAVDDTIHFISRFQRELRVDGDVGAAASRAMVAVGSALLTTTLVLVTGFAAVLTSEMPSSRLFAWMSCLAIAAALIGDLVILPALMVCFVKAPPSTGPKKNARTLEESATPG